MGALKKINGDRGAVFVRSLMIIMIADLCDSLNISDHANMTDDQIKVAAELIEERFHYFKPEDFKLAFNWMKSGKYGKIFNRIDIAIIFDALEKYEEERCALAIQQSERLHSDSKSTAPKLAGNETAEEFYQRVRDREAAIKAGTWEEPITAKQVAQQLEDQEEKRRNDEGYRKFKEEYRLKKELERTQQEQQDQENNG